MEPIIPLSNGHMLDLLKPDVSSVTVQVLAQALGNTCRFGGHCRHYYSVAQHSVHVSRLVSPGLALTALFHDAAEAFIGDIPSPLKKLLPMASAIERNIIARLADKFEFLYPFPDEIHRADLQALRFEREWLLPSTGGEWAILEGVPMPPGERFAQHPELAAREFVYRYNELTARSV